MSVVESAEAGQHGEDARGQPVSPLELFFDLVFVFALTQVTAFLSDHLTWIGMLQGAALWWAWVTNAIPADELIPARLVILTAMAAVLVASLAVPDAFGTYGVIFGVAYLVVRLLQVTLYALAASRTSEMSQAILRLAPGYVGAPC